MKQLIKFIFLTIAIGAFGESTVVVHPEGYDGTSPNISMRDVSYDDAGITVIYNITDLLIHEDTELYPGTVYIDIPNFGQIDKVGNYSMPYRMDSFELPSNCSNVNITILNSDYTDYDYSLTPARPCLADNDDTPLTKSNVPPASKSHIKSESSILSTPYYTTKTNRRFVNVDITPVSYDSEGGKTRVFYKFSYRIEFIQDVNSTTMEFSPKFPTYEDSENTYVETTCDYLILTPGKYAELCNEFAISKRKFGYDTHVVSSDTWDNSSIKNCIKEYYLTLPQLKYVLIVGNYNDMPSNNSSRYITEKNANTYGRTFPTDIEYVCMDGDDDYDADIYIGRLPVNNDFELSSIFEKIMSYESFPVETESFYRSGTHCAFFQSADGTSEERRFVHTSEDIRDYMLQFDKSITRIYCAKNGVTPQTWNDGRYGYGENIPTDLLDSSYNWTGNKESEIISALNSGCFYILHRDHGAVTYWDLPRLTISKLSTITNKSLTPVVFSLNCLTGKFDETSFAEKFLTMDGNGAVAVFAASYVSYSGYNDAMALGMFNCIWPSPGLYPPFSRLNPQVSHQCNPEQKYTLGSILEAGIERCEDIYSKISEATIATKKRFHIFGDPSMEIRTEVPRDFDATEFGLTLDEINFQSNEFKITFEFNPEYDNCSATIWSPEGYIKSLTGYAYFTGIIPQDAVITIHGPNHKPLNIPIKTTNDAYPNMNIYISNGYCHLKLDTPITPRNIRIGITSLSAFSFPGIMQTVEGFTQEAKYYVGNLSSGLYSLVVTDLSNGNNICSKKIKLSN